MNEDEIIIDTIDFLTNKYGHIPELVSIESEGSGNTLSFIITVTSPISEKIPNLINIKDNGDSISYPLSIREGPDISLDYYDTKKDSILDPLDNISNENLHAGVIEGGSRIWHRDLGGFGTLAFTARRIQLRNGRTCDVSNACLSNNHVLALWDSASVGDPINTTNHTPFATLSCWLPVTGTSRNNDTAMGQVIDVSHTNFSSITGIGMLNGVTRPNNGQHIQKSGARTGVTTGRIDGFATIRVNGRLFRSVMIETSGFACKGDSGSAVLSLQREFLGLHFAGQSLPCSQNPKGYFIPAIPMNSHGAYVAESISIVVGDNTYSIG